MLFESAFEKFRINDIPIREYPYHAEDYATQLVELSTHLNLSVEEMLRRIATRILNHTYDANCIMCKVEPMK